MSSIAVVVLDTLRKDAISPYDDTIEHTPHLDEFATDATTYTNAVAQAPWSLPSQASLLTGLYPWEHGASQGQPFLRPDTPLLQEKLRDAGYRTRAIHENTWLVPATGAMRGFDAADTPADGTRYARRLWRAAHAVGPARAGCRRLIRSLSDRRLASKRGKPTDSKGLLARTERFLDDVADDDFFLYLNLVNAHYPYTPPAEYRAAHGVATACADLTSRPIEYGGPFDPSEHEALERLYAAEVDYLDDVFGEIVRAFADRGLAEETLFVVTADHGELLGEDDIVGHHFSVREELTNVPLLVNSPADSGGECDAVTELRELHYDVLRYAGLDATDEGRLLDDHAVGMYQDPVIYGPRLPPARQSMRCSQVYAVDDAGRGTLRDVDPARLRAADVQLREKLRDKINLASDMEGVATAHG